MPSPDTGLPRSIGAPATRALTAAGLERGDGHHQQADCDAAEADNRGQRMEAPPVTPDGNVRPVHAFR